MKCFLVSAIINYIYSVFRYICVGCAILGPHGDDKNGCRDVWQGYSLSVNRPSTITSFHDNRFNNCFQAAASLHYHRHDIQHCLETYVKKRNGKIGVVQTDCQDDVTDVQMIALGLIYFRITGKLQSFIIQLDLSLIQ